MDDNLINAIHWSGMAWANGTWARAQPESEMYDSSAVMFARSAMRQARTAEELFEKCDPDEVADTRTWL